MNLKVIWTTKFKKDYKLAIKRNLNIELLDNVIRLLHQAISCHPNIMTIR